MSLEAARSFRQELSASPELQAALNKIRSGPDRETCMRNLLALGASKGFHFTDAEVQTVETEAVSTSDELSDFELELVAAGGISGPVSAV